MEQVLDALLSDDEEFGLNDEPMMAGSDDEFSDLRVASDDDDDIDETPAPVSTRHPYLQCTLRSLHLYSLCQLHLLTVPPTWSDTLTPVTIQPFTSPVGPTIPIPESPIGIFKLFFTEDVLQAIVDESNRYAKQVIRQERFDQWTKITLPELRAYVGFCILMGINKLPCIEDYWRCDPALHNSALAERITRDRFCDIAKYIHFVNNDTLIPRGSLDVADSAMFIPSLITSQPNLLSYTTHTVD